MTSRRISQILIISGAALLVAACGIFIYNQIFDYNAGRQSQDLLDSMMEEFEWDLPPLSEMVFTPSQNPSESVTDNPEDAAPETPTPTPTPMPEPSPETEPPDEEDEPPSGDQAPSTAPSIPVYTTLGILSIPKLNVRLPVISESTDANLRISVCRLSGLANNKPIRLVIVGHNISSHFKGLDTFQPGDQIAFTDKEGVTYYYGAVELLDLYQTDGADVLAADGWDITLITCKTDNTWRTVVRFAELS